MSRARQSGAAAVEFALVFPVLFLLTYGVVVYAYTLILQEAISYAAQEAAEAAVAVNPRVANSDAVRNAQVRATASAVLDWLPSSQKSRVIGSAAGEKVQVQYCSGGSGGTCPGNTDGVIVTLQFDMAAPDNLFPVLDLPLVGKVPPLPATLTAKAVARV